MTQPTSVRFCVQCGAAWAEGARFCAQCGAPHPGQAEDSPPRSAASSPGPSWDALQSHWWISGCFNVESGHGAVSTRYFENCDCHMGPRAGGTCAICGRSDANSQTCATGHGDGVYPVFVLEDGAGQVTGAVALFVEDWALGVEDRTKAPARIVDVATPVLVGAIETPGTLLFNEAYTGFDDRNMTVDVDVPPGRYEVIAWLGEVPTLRDNAMPPFVRPIALGVYSRDLVTALDVVARVDREPAAFEPYRPWNTMAWGVMSHKVPEWGKAARYNYTDDSKRGAEERAASWLLQAAVHGDADAQQAVASFLHSSDPAAVLYRQRLLFMRGQVERANSDVGVDRELIGRAMSQGGNLREQARRAIIDACDIDAMRACAEQAEATGDAEDAEFWWLEIATAPPAASEEQIVAGVIGLCSHVLLPQGRYEEAELYCRHLLTRPTEESRLQGRELLDRIEADRRSRGVRRLVPSDAWRRVDISQPAQPTSDQQAHYDRLYAYLEATADKEHLQRLLSVDRDEFLSFVAGWLIGFAGSDGASKSGVSRETAAHTLREWMLDRGCRQLARDAAPGGTGLTKTTSGL